MFETQGHGSAAIGAEPKELYVANGFFYGGIGAEFRDVGFSALRFAAEEFAHMEIVELSGAARVGAFGKHKATTSPGEFV